MKAEFQRKQGGKVGTYWLHIDYTKAEHQAYLALSDELRVQGWTSCAPMNMPLPEGLEERWDDFAGPRGSGLFRGWTTSEQRAFMAGARKVLRKHGLKAGRRTLGLADLL